MWITQLCASWRAVRAGVQCQKYCLFKASYQLEQCQQCSEELCMHHHFNPLVAFVWAIGEVIGRYVPTTVLRSRSVDKQWFDDSCRRAYVAKQTAYLAWCRTCNAEHWGQFVLARAEAKRVYGAAKDSHNERNMNTLQHSTCSHM